MLILIKIKENNKAVIVHPTQGNQINGIQEI